MIHGVLCWQNERLPCLSCPFPACEVRKTDTVVSGPSNNSLHSRVVGRCRVREAGHDYVVGEGIRRRTHV